MARYFSDLTCPMDQRERCTEFVWLFEILCEGCSSGRCIDSFLYWKEKNVIVSRVAPTKQRRCSLTTAVARSAPMDPLGTLEYLGFTLSIVINWYYSEKLCNSVERGGVFFSSRDDKMKYSDNVNSKQNAGLNFQYILV